MVFSLDNKKRDEREEVKKIRIGRRKDYERKKKNDSKTRKGRKTKRIRHSKTMITVKIMMISMLIISNDKIKMKRETRRNKGNAEDKTSVLLRMD